MENHVTISPGNNKMGAVKSVSLPPGITCADLPCKEKCYAKRIEHFRKTVRETYAKNLRILNEDREKYFREVESAVMMSRFFRFHVGGDIPDYDYLERMAELASRNKHCHILCFTKRYHFVNTYIIEHEAFPDNLHIILSGWAGVDVQNPFGLPEAHVLAKDGTTTARADAKLCAGNCTTCAETNGGCWNLKAGEQIVFREH